MAILSDQEFLRYDRQISLKGFDIDGQERLKQSSALIIGLGGLGCSAAQYLAASGIGQLTLVDFDTVSLSNLHRQILHTEQSINQHKVDSAAQALKQINPSIQLQTLASALDDDALAVQLQKQSIVLDCSDNLATREQINRLCYQYKVPLVSGAAIRMEGLLSTFIYQDNQPCYHCLSQLFGQDHLTCAESGVMSPLVGMIGAMQAMEAIKVLTQFGKPLIGRLLTVDAMTMQFTEIKFNPLPHCPICSHA
ncbi:molybdopterin-synthase adenylyltransferase MoeB [Utexia brackfieldae]